VSQERGLKILNACSDRQGPDVVSWNHHLMDWPGQLAALLHGLVGPRRDDPQNNSNDEEPECVELKNDA
jgi:hypothetical protein